MNTARELPIRLENDRRRDELSELFGKVRGFSEALSEPLEPEDQVVQTMPDVSPTKWHLAHTTWFFEQFVVRAGLPDYRSPDDRYHHIFNSYYKAVGEPFPRPRRGLLSRPTVPEVSEYRRRVDEGVRAVLADASDESFEKLGPVIEVGLNHEEQHQELILTDIKHVLAQNPLHPAYRKTPAAPPSPRTPAIGWCCFGGGEVQIGFDGDGFAFDNEGPNHPSRVQPFELSDRLVTCGEYMEFIEDGGYERFELWLADGWDRLQAERWNAPLYWERTEDGWHVTTMGGWRRVDPREPVCHVSLYEADAFARWAGVRLPTEIEWEVAAGSRTVEGNFVGSSALHPRPLARIPDGEPAQLFGDAWEWTASPYVPYPGYEPFEGDLGEYNGKFMCNQMVLRGGSCVTPKRHIRATYRNFLYPHQRWQFTGIRLAR